MAVSRILVAWVLTSVIVSEAAADRKTIGMVPARPSTHGFQVTVELETVAGNGYHPLHLRFRPLGRAFPADRQIEVMVVPRPPRSSTLNFEFRQQVSLPQGAREHSATLLVPHYFPWNEVEIRFRENGEDLKNAYAPLSIHDVRIRQAGQQVAVGVVLPREAFVAGPGSPPSPTPPQRWQWCPDVRTLVTVLGQGPIPEGDQAQTRRLSHPTAISKLREVQPAKVQFRVLPEQQLPERWLGHSELDLILVAAPLLERLERTRPAQCEALRMWLAAGGHLWVYAAETPAIQRGEFFSGVEFTRPSPALMLAPEIVPQMLRLTEPNDVSDIEYDSYLGAIKRSEHYGYRQQFDFTQRRVVFNRLQSENHPFALSVPRTRVADRITQGSFGLGQVVALADEDPFPGSFQLWSSIVNLHSEDRLQWNQRMGIDVPKGNDNYWMWLIPSVGQPPVFSFLLLNTLFVILVGPACYFFFRRRGRLYLLYFFAPALALVVTICLFVYALVSDGIYTQVRARQLTWVDPVAGYHAGLSRQTYYSAFGDSDAVQVDSNTAVYPVQYAPAYRRYYYDRRLDSRLPGRISVGPDGQRFHGGFFPARSQVQFLMASVQASQASVQLHETGGEPEASHDLPDSLKHLVISDDRSRLWHAADVPPGQRVALTRVKPSLLNQLFDEDVIPPLGNVPMLRNNRAVSGGMTTGVQVSLLERRLERWCKNMPRQTFMAIAPLRSERIGLQDARTTHSVHVVMGRLP